MSWLVALILKIASGGILDKALDLLRARADNATEQERITSEVAIEHIKAELAARQAAKDVLLAEQGRWWTALPRPLFAIPLGIWWTAVIADSLFHFSWDVAALPHPLDQWAGGIITALFLVDGGERITRTVLGARKGSG